MSSSDDPSINLSVSRSALRRALYILGAIVLVAVLVFVAVRIVRAATGGDDVLASQVDSNTYQAVFLANSEVYFGKLSVPAGSSFCYLTHVYRLTALASKQGKTLPQRTLVKLVADIHGPRDLMVINRAQILYVENLNPSGQGYQLLQRGGP